MFSSPSISAVILQVTRSHHRLNLAQFDTRRNLVGKGTASSMNVMGTAMAVDMINPREKRDDLIKSISQAGNSYSTLGKQRRRCPRQIIIDRNISRDNAFIYLFLSFAGSDQYGFGVHGQRRLDVT